MIFEKLFSGLICTLAKVEIWPTKSATEVYISILKWPRGEGALWDVDVCLPKSENIMFISLKVHSVPS